jgi:hypothetical protein
MRRHAIAVARPGRRRRRSQRWWRFRRRQRWFLHGRERGGCRSARISWGAKCRSRRGTRTGGVARISWTSRQPEQHDGSTRNYAIVIGHHGGGWNARHCLTRCAGVGVASNGKPTAPSTGAGSTGTAGVADGLASGMQGTNPNNTAAQTGITQSRSGAPLKGIATLNAEKKRGVAEPPSEEKRTNEQILDQANRSIQRTQRETTTTPSGAPAVR